MRSTIISGVVASLAATTSATGVLLPLYVYPSAVAGDGAANWQPAFDAISAHSNVPWLVVIDPANGPGSGGPGNGDQNYIAGVSRLNGYGNVRTVGYVRTNYGNQPMQDVQNDITAWRNWATYAAADVSVKGIFFDESSTNSYSYLSQAIGFARSTFPSPITTICNFGASASANFYGICDVVIAFESCLNCAGSPQYQSQTTLSANIPRGFQSQAAIIVHDFSGTAYDGTPADANLLSSYESTISRNGVGWSYFCSAGYNTITAGPATVGLNAQDLA
ncbi:Spherulin-4 [Tolypocladium ophioglossoides CBS 100239]|uniref:Spherulin-4 n=1 Tax=Tolypocladium ophioglossoides (strain CBS 100239) TaxID=1163406 RepID=A0A0L0NMT4_TOLOC|nr:Spherulin-4 [Tolypocladium ophioglossoides CBS 100239]